MTKDLLPIGSVIKLHGAEKKLMITGISVQQENDSKVYDYIAVPFPERLPQQRVNVSLPAR